MLKSLLSTALGNLLKDKTASVLNIFVLTFVITFALLLLVNLLFESSYDRYHRKAHNLYRIASNVNDGDSEYMWDVSQASLGPELLKRYPEVRNAARFSAIGSTVFKNGSHRFEESGFYVADPSVFEMFTYEFIAGNAATALKSPFSLVVTEKIARKYFGSARAALNQILKNEDGGTFFISGVIEDVPPNSHFIFDALLSSRSAKALQGGWGNFNTHTYIELPENYNAARMCNHLKTLAREKLNPIGDQLEVRISYRLQPLTRIHQSRQAGDGTMASGESTLLFVVLAVVAGMIAFMLFMKKQTLSRSADRLFGEELKERMGIRRGALIVQLITESVCITVISFLISLMLVFALLPVVNNLLNKEIPFSMLWHSSVLLSMLGVFLFAGLVGAVYPSLYLPKIDMLRELRRNSLKKEEIYLV